MSHYTIGGISQQCCDVLADVVVKLGNGTLTIEELKLFAVKKNPWPTQEGAPSVPIAKGRLFDIDWVKAYDAMGLGKEFKEQFPDWKGSTNDSVWTVPVIKGLTHAQIEVGFQKSGIALWKYTNDLDVAIPKHDRDPQSGAYAVSFKRTVEADPCQKNKSADMLAEEDFKGITFIERMLLEFGYFLTTGKHLDVKDATLCSGSRGSDGHVPSVGWGAGDRGVYVYWYDRDGRHPSLRSRAVVSLP